MIEKTPVTPAAGVPLKVREAASNASHDGNGEPGGSEAHEPPALTGKNKAELLAIADAEGVDVEEGATNAAIVEAIEAARLDAEAPPA